MKYDWDKLNSLQLGRYAEYFTKMEFTLYGFDIYEPEVDNKGIDFIIRKSENMYFEIQVKSIYKGNYVFMPKDKFKLKENLYLVLVMFERFKPPKLYLIPSIAWYKPNKYLVSRDYPGKKSKPEWGLYLANKNILFLSKYEFDKMVQNLVVEI